ncbi:MAG: ribose-phosphate pyrophosphokinase [Candidatus Omnitrophica bacterium]|nr:ribose-phosphate pyrophosphokinase [Candidatus Omnitrophota bacterium]
MKTKISVFTGNAHPALAQEICDHLDVPLSRARVGRFSEGEISVKIEENVRGKDVFVVQPTCPPPNEHLMELLIMLDALRRASARRITAVVPYFGYARQDRKDQPRVPITAKLVANLITVAGANRVLTIDLHAGQLQGFFDLPLDNLYAINVFVDHVMEMNIDDLAVVSPDVGGIKMARAYAKRFGAALAIVDKRRLSPDSTEVMNIMGDVKGKNVLIIDDIIATAGSICEASVALKAAGARDIFAAITHPVLSGPALERLEKAPIKTLFVTNTIPLDDRKKRCSKIEMITIASLLAEAIQRIHNEASISELFVESYDAGGM